MSHPSDYSLASLSNHGSPSRKDTKDSEASFRAKLGWNPKHKLGRPLPGRFLKVIDCPLDGTEIRNVDATRADRDVNFIDLLPSQAHDVVRVILDGDESMVTARGHESLASGPQCVKQSNKTYLSKVSGRPGIVGDFTHGRAYYWPHLRDIISGNQARRWFLTDTYAYHDNDCGYWKGDIFSQLQYTGNHESDRAYFTVTQDSSGRYIVICIAPGASRTAGVGEKDPESNLHRAGAICANANWRWLAMVNHALRNDEQGSTPTPHSPTEMLEHLVLRILVGSHRRNTKLLEVLQGADVLNRWPVHTVRPSQPAKLNKLSELVVSLRSIERTIVGLTTSLNWLSCHIRERLNKASSSIDNTATLTYLDVSADECHYGKQEIATQLSLHNELYKVLAQRISIEQANSVNQLTLLAAFFLPLSLAAAVLSMQTRFVDLNLLLYDFIGVMVILTALASLVALFNLYGKKLYSQLLHKVYYALGTFPRYPRRVTIFWMFFWMSALLASFLLGMLSDVTLGVKLLGYEAAAIVLLWLLSLPSFKLFVRLRRY